MKIKLTVTNSMKKMVFFLNENETKGFYNE